MIIGITGRAGSGKDTFADLLVAHHGFVKRSFADPLYEEAAKAFGVTVDWLRDRGRKEVPQPQLALADCLSIGFQNACSRVNIDAWHLPRSPRQILQLWGTEFRRYQNENYWLDKMQGFIEANQGRSVAIPDCRFDNEGVFVVKNGGHVCQIRRDGIDAVATHASENGLQRRLIHAFIDNNGSLDFLREQADALVARYQEMPA